MALIDTPGIGSTFRHNTEATVNFLPQCDAALFVVSADPPITEVEVEFLKLARRKLARLFFILNKMDYLDADEQPCRRRVSPAGVVRTSWLRRATADLLRLRARAWRLAGTKTPPPGNAAVWRRSNTGSSISCSRRRRRCSIARSAGKRATFSPTSQRRLKLTLRCLHTPLAELDGRIRLFEESLTKIDEQRIVLMDRLGQDEQRLASSVKKHADPLLPEEPQVLPRGGPGVPGPGRREWAEEPTREAIAGAMPGFYRARIRHGARSFASKSCAKPCCPTAAGRMN